MNIDISLRDILDFVASDIKCDVYALRSIDEHLLLLWSGYPKNIFDYIDLTEKEYKIAYIDIRDGRLQLVVVEV